MMKRFFPGRVRVGRSQADRSPPFQALLPRGWDGAPSPAGRDTPAGGDCEPFPISRRCPCATDIEAQKERPSAAKKSRPRSFASWFGVEKASTPTLKQTVSHVRLSNAVQTDGKLYSRKDEWGPEKFTDVEAGFGVREGASPPPAQKETTAKRRLVFPGRAVLSSFQSRSMEPAKELPGLHSTGSPDENREPLAALRQQPQKTRKDVPRRQVLGVLEERGALPGVRSRSTLELSFEELQSVGGGRLKRPGSLKRVASPIAMQSPGGKYLKRLNDGVDTPVLILSAHSHGLPKLRKGSEVKRRQSTGTADGLLPDLSLLTIGAGASPAGGAIFDAPKDSTPIWKRRRVSCPRSIAVPLPPPPISVS